MIIDGVLICVECGERVEEVKGEPVVCVSDVDLESCRVVYCSGEHDCENKES